MTDISTLECLWAWARWAGGAPGGYPPRSPMFGERALKTPLYGEGHIPPDVARVESCVCALDPSDRALLVSKYIWRAHIREIATRFGISYRRAFQLIRSAEAEFHKRFVA